VADNQFANLGLMLVGTLARFRRVIQPFSKIKDEAEDAEIKLDESLIKQGDLDLGEVVKREDLGRSKDADDEDVHVELGKSKKEKRSAGMQELGHESMAESTPSKPRKKKRKRGGDEFDDLFGSLLS